MAATLGIVITADNQQALIGLQQTSNAANQLGNSFGKIPNASNQANQALVNSGRILQDLNYGFMGIANNLNPLLESFQRLSEKAKESGTSVKKELISSLTGPAGLGLALSLVTFVFLKFGDEISNYVTKITSGGAATVAMNKSFEASKDEFIKISGELTHLGQSFDDFHSKTLSKKAVLEEYNTVLGKVFGTTKDINEAEKIFRENTDKYLESVLARAVGEEALKEASKIGFEIKQAERIPAYKFSTYDPNTETGSSDAQNEANKAEFINDIKKRRQVYIDIYKSSNKEAKDLIKGLAVTANFNDGFTSITKDPLAEATKDYQDSNKRNITLLDESLQSQKQYFIESEKIWQEYVNKLKGINTTAAINILKGLTPKEILKDETYDADLEEKARGISSFSKSQLYVTDLLAPLGTKDPEGRINKKKINTTKNEMTEFLKQTEEGFKKAHEAANSFANDMSSNITSALQNAFQAVKQGENVFESLSNSVLQFAEDLLFAIIRAKLLAAIQGVITVSSGGAAGAAAGGKGFFDILMGLLGVGQKHAAGGIVTSPQIGMIGEAGAEAIMPLSKLSGMLNTTFSAGAMSGGGGMSNGSFVLRGNDLVLALQRSNSSLNLRRGGI
jgi:ElaB/YqjD/DUF883 family membrane-anchored ribosome-binding protein